MRQKQTKTSFCFINLNVKRFTSADKKNFPPCSDFLLFSLSCADRNVHKTGEFVFSLPARNIPARLNHDETLKSLIFSHCCCVSGLEMVVMERTYCLQCKHARTMVTIVTGRHIAVPVCVPKKHNLNQT